jgi:ribosomal protein S18 acetylase RimI-like enzyme
VSEREFRDLAAGELAAAGGVAGRALADSPTFRWVAGDEPLARVAQSLDVFVGYVEAMPAPQLGAFVGRHVVGVCAAAAPGSCVGATAPAEWQQQPSEIGPPGHESRALSIWALFYEHDIDERHWHVGPVSVEPGLQGAGVGSAMLRVFCSRMDDAGELAWLETDKPENVVFYRRHGFDVVAEEERYGFTTWFMRRDPRPPDHDHPPSGGR